MNLRIATCARRVLAVACLACSPLPAHAAAPQFTLLHVFDGASDGRNPDSTLTRQDGTLYGTTQWGGYGGVGDGIVFSLAKDGTYTILHAFSSPPPWGSDYDGSEPWGGVLFDRQGNLFGTTSQGYGPYADGIVFKIAADGTYTIFHTFSGADGAFPIGNLYRDRRGSLYGATLNGGSNSLGTVYKLKPNGKIVVLHSFEGSADGAHPYGGVTMDTMGNLYGTTDEGGGQCSESNAGCGTLFKLAPDGTKSTIHTFAGGADGALPLDDLVLDASQNLYGVTIWGGGNTNCPKGCGTVYKIAPDGTETIVHVFGGSRADGALPRGLASDAQGNLYGATESGGFNNIGTVFKVAPDGTEEVLVNFTHARGLYPSAGVILDKHGRIYGTAGYSSGHEDDGTVFEITP